MRRLIPCLFVALVSGCASTTEVRGLADKTGVFVTSLNEGTSSFLDNQNRLNTEDAARLDQMVANGTTDRATVRQQTLAWVDSGDTVRSATFQAAVARSPGDIIAGLESKPSDAPRVSATALAGYTAAMKALSEAATKPKSTAALRELIEFGHAVMDDYADLKDAADEATAAAAKTATTTDSTAKAAGTAAATPK